MPIDLAQVDWLYVAILAVFVFLACLVGNVAAFGNRTTAAVISALLFAVIFIGWTYYPHHLPLPTSLAARTPPVTAAPPSATPAPQPPAAAPVRPANPVRDITPPKP